MVRNKDYTEGSVGASGRASFKRGVKNGGNFRVETFRVTLT